MQTRPYTHNSTPDTLASFKELVDTKFQLYNSLFISLPFHRLEKTGILLSLFLLHCEDGYDKGQSPQEIVTSFFNQYTTYTEAQQKTDLLFRFIQYVERQVVLFDALEDAAFRHIHNMQGMGTLRHLQSEVMRRQNQQQLINQLKDFSVRLVLTAHPTQFYPGEVLGIINDLSKALINDDTTQVNIYLQQLGKTPFFKKEKPTPYDEAVSLIWYLENVFYQAADRIIVHLKAAFPEAVCEMHSLIRMGFWPGGDRDGNPFVHAPTTLKVAQALRKAAIRSYYRDVRQLKRRLTFRGVEDQVAVLEKKLYNELFTTGQKPALNKQEILGMLRRIRDIIVEEHNGLFLHLIETLISKMTLFGLYFASLDVRQDSSVHRSLLEVVAAQTNALPHHYKDLAEEDKINALLQIDERLDPAILQNAIHRDVLETIIAMKSIQQTNGEEGAHRYIISHSMGVLDVMEVYALFLLSGWKPETLTVDIVPLFETIDDLRQADQVMQTLYKNEVYRKHLQLRGWKQTIMLGFSDGTKDGGYLMANWSIYKAKEALTRLSEQYSIDTVFFDGRGGPPARGGGKTHQFYASMGKYIASKEIQLTIQGQTISSNFGTIDAAQYNIEQLIHAGLANALFSACDQTLSDTEKTLLQSLAEESYTAFSQLKTHPHFLEYFDQVSPLRYYAQANIGSRPSKRHADDQLSLDDLRAVPYVGAWSQLKQNVPGYYGVGTALEQLDQAGHWDEVRRLYQHSLYFKTLMDNCEMAMKKTYFPLTAHLVDHPKYGEIWKMIYEEFLRTKTYVLQLSGATELMISNPRDEQSIEMRERIVLPLATIQQYALANIHDQDSRDICVPKEICEKLVVRCSFGLINAGRNSA
ncbi:MAG: phosphoenolpyruvate carboxylase [Flavobacteriales bacterium AspAUS03]